MGNVESSSYQKHLLRFLPDELADIENIFSALSGPDEAVGAKPGKAAKKAVTLGMLKAYVKAALPESMVIRLHNGMKSVQLAEKAPGAGEQVSKEQFVIFTSALIKGNAEEKSSIVLRMISKAEGAVRGRQVLEFAQDLVASVVHVLDYRKELKGWNLRNTRSSTAGVKTLASRLTSELKVADGRKGEGAPVLDAVCDERCIADWVFRAPQISALLTVILQQGLLVLRSLPDQAQDPLHLLPACKGTKGSQFVSLLDIPSVAYLNSQLPSELRHTWRLLFASQVHGESFTQLCGHIVNKGPCVLVLRDADGYIFGGFSSCSWEVKPTFQGDNSCFLFTVSPSLAVFTYTGYNDHYMYLNHGQQTMPNGLGMGGQHDYFGLWIDSNYGKGHSKAKPRCSTYNSPQLSSKENFTLDAMEVWAVGDHLANATAKGPKSILDADPEAQALLEMIGKSRQSEGLREPVSDEDDN